MAGVPHRRVTSKAGSEDPSVELSAQRTGMSFQRTRMSADRTLMSVIRTSLSLIGFGFTIYQVFEKLLEAGAFKSSATPRLFGQALVLLGVAMLVLGISYHMAFMIELRRRRDQLKREGLIHAESRFPASLTLIVAIALLAVGLVAALGMTYGVGPFV